MKFLTVLAVATTAAAQCLPKYAMCPDFQGAPTCANNGTLGTSPEDFTIIGPPLQAVHESAQPPTGLALDNDYNIYLIYPRNAGQTPSNVVIANNFTSESPWPNAAIQNCTTGQNLSTCFLNVQNVVLDSQGVMWIVDSGIPASQNGSGNALPGGAKVMSFNVTTKQLIRTYPIPTALLANGTNANDVRINNTLGAAGFAFITDESQYGSVLAGDLATNTWVKRLGNTTVVKADPMYVGSYNGQPLYAWNGTKKGYLTTGADGIALASGNMYWGVLASRRFYYMPQSVLADFSLSDAEVQAAVVDPGQLGSEQAGFTADDKGRVYMLASEQNAIYYVDTQQSQVTEEVNGVAPGGNGTVPAANYVVKSLVRSGLIQHADSAAIMPDGYLYFCTNQLELRPANQYNNVDHRRGPFRSYRVYVGAGPAV